MKKVFLLSLIMVLLGALIVPTIAAPVPAEAAGTTVACSPSDLHFRVYAGVPTYLLGFIPLDDGQEVTLTLSGSGISGWTVSDDAGWLNENLLFGVLSSISSDTRNQDIIVRVNTDGLTAGKYTATITFKFTTCGTKTITVPVTVDVIEPKVMGPLGIGVDKDLSKILSGEIFAETNEYGGLTVQLLTNPEDTMDMQAIETDGCWDMVLQRGDEIPGMGFPVTGGTLSISGETKQITSGGIFLLPTLIEMMGQSLPNIPADFDWGENYAAMLITSDGTAYIGILLADVGKLLDLLAVLDIESMFSVEEPAGTDVSGPPGVNSNTGDPNGSPTANVDMVIPLSPIMMLLPTLMPVMTDLLSNETVLSILKPLMELLPPIMIVMPMSVMMELANGLM